MKDKELKLLVQEKYGQIARQSLVTNEVSCCGTGGCCGTVDYAVFSERYDKEKGYDPEADLGLGCGIPTQFTSIKEGDSVLDLGSGAGNDCFVARAIVGETGRVTGIDFTEAMVDKARKNNQRLGFNNVAFVQGDIENMPFEEGMFDVVVSNCVLNLVPDKQKAFGEVYRVLRTGGHFCVSDVVLRGQLPEALQQEAAMYAGCVSGAIQLDEYLDIIAQQGFKDITVHKKKAIKLPTALLNPYMNQEEIEAFHQNGHGIFSVTVSAKK